MGGGFATPFKVSQLARLKFEFELPEYGGIMAFRFRLRDRLQVHRREWVESEHRWKSFNFYQTLGYALAETLNERARMADCEGQKAAVAWIEGCRDQILALKSSLPPGYWG